MIRPGDSECRGDMLCRQPLRREPIEQGSVEFFGEVVAELVGAVDAALYVGELRVSGAGCAGFVFDVPEVEVGVVLAGDAAEPGVSRTGILSGSRQGMPGSGCFIVEFYDCIC